MYNEMNDMIKAAIIFAVAILIAMGMWIYFSPYQTCVRAQTESLAKWIDGDPVKAAQRTCSK
jgi:hypothetical protein